MTSCRPLRCRCPFPSLPFFDFREPGAFLACLKWTEGRTDRPLHFLKNHNSGVGGGARELQYTQTVRLFYSKLSHRDTTTTNARNGGSLAEKRSAEEGGREVDKSRQQPGYSYSY